MLYAYIQTTIPANFASNNVMLFSNLPQVLGVSGFTHRHVKSPLFSVKTNGSANDIVADAYAVIARGNASPYITKVFITLANVSPFSPFKMANCSSVNFIF